MHTFITIFLLAVQSCCDGAPRNKYPVLHIPDDVALNGGFMYDEGDEEKRASPPPTTQPPVTTPALTTLPVTTPAPTTLPVCTPEQLDEASLCTSLNLCGSGLESLCSITCGLCQPPLPTTQPPVTTPALTTLPVTTPAPTTLPAPPPTTQPPVTTPALTTLPVTTPAPTTLPVCTKNEKDKKSSCPYWEAKGYCDQGHIYHDFMMDNCYASCGYCELPPTPPPAVDKIACLQAHNAKRDIHGASPLVWDDTLEQHAKEWADHLLSEGKGLKHATQTGEGENLYWGKASSHRTCEDAMNGWYDKEVKLYDYNNPGFSRETGHFTQVVWKATTAVGVALAANKSEDGWIETYIVARYSPQGNIRGRFAENVKRPQ